MDNRVWEQAEIIVNHSTSIEAGDAVLLEVPPAAEDLGIAIAELVGERDAMLYAAYPNLLQGNTRITSAYLNGADSESIQTPSHSQALYEEMDVGIMVRGEQNVTQLEDVPLPTQSAFRTATEPLMAAYLETRWCATQYPTTAYAQLAGMSTHAYEDFVWDAINRDWDAQRAQQAKLVEILEEASDIRIQCGETTDLRASLDGMGAVNDDGQKNLPGGEVFTTPVIDSVEGEILFDVPVYHQGEEIVDAYLRFEDGEVVSHTADSGEAVLDEILATDTGAKRVGELGFGMNRDIDRPTSNILFDEKMGDTVHLALGFAYGMTVGEHRDQNESAVHIDMVVDMSEDARIEVDGETIQQDGVYRFEDGY